MLLFFSTALRHLTQWTTHYLLSTLKPLVLTGNPLTGLSDRFRAVLADGCQSNFLSVLKGVSQGCILGHILFTLYINDFSIVIPNSAIHQYADDTIIYSVAPSADLAINNLQSDFHIIEQALTDHKLLLNPKKTKCLLFTRLSPSSLINSSISTLNGTPIERVL